MSINVYFSEKVREFSGFKSEPYGDGPDYEATLNGMHLFQDRGRLFFTWGEDAVIPDEFKDLIGEISCHESIPQMGYREAGIYRHETAECELTPEDYSNDKRKKPVYKLKIIAKNLEDIRGIMRMVKTGRKSDGSSFRPDESYETPQGEKSRKELEDELATAQQELEFTQTLAEGLREVIRLADLTKKEEDARHLKVGDILCNTRQSFRQLASNLSREGFAYHLFYWPFCKKEGIVREINTILDIK